MAESTGPTDAGPAAGASGGAGSLSDFWRVNTSNLEATELANLLRALRKVAGTLGDNVGDVIYAGMTASPGDIILDPEYVLGAYPVSPWKVDYLVGLVVHEALHGTEWSDLVWSGAKQARPDLNMREKVVLSKIIQAGEDIYVDSIAERSVLGLYVRRARRRAMDEMGRGLDASVVSLDRLLYLWRLSAWGMEAGEDGTAACARELAELRGLTPGLMAVIDSGEGVVGRCGLRRDIYLRALDSVRETAASWKIIDKAVPLTFLDGRAASVGKGGRAGPAGDKGGSGRGAEPDIEALREIEARMAADSGKITPVIASFVDDPEQEILPTRLVEYNMPALSVVDRRQAERLKAIIRNYAERKVLISRGLTSGKVDRKRLYRAPISGACFLDRQRVPDASWSICLLIDASGSMGRGPSWKLVETAVATLHEAFRGTTNRLNVWAYYESHGVCVLTSLLKGKELMSVSPIGETPSGQAIIAAAYLMPRDRKRKLMVHITDGASNAGCHVRYGIDYCRRQHVQLITLGCGREDRGAMLEQYGRSVQFIDYFAQLPFALEKLLKWAFQYGYAGKPAAPKGIEKVLDTGSA